MSEFAPDLTYRNLEAERSVLGAAIQDPKAAELVAEMAADEFNEPEHRVIHMAIQRMVKAHTPIDLLTIHKVLSEQKQDAITGGAAYLAKLVGSVPTTANVKTYINIVRECCSRRRMRAIGQALIEASADGTRTVDEIREKAAVTIRDVKAGESIRLISQEEAAITTYEKLAEQQKREDQPETERIATGIKGIDKRTGGGLIGSKLMMIGARPSVGKSIFALTMCLNAARQQKRVLLSTLEMEADEITERVFANESLVPLTEITSDEISADSWVKLAEALPKVSYLPLYYCTDADTVEELRRAAFSMYENGGIDLICVDYLQLMTGTKNRYGSRQEEVADISRGLKKLARELNVPIIALTQLSRFEKRDKGRKAPTMSDARESGAIEQDANIFILLHDPEIDELKTEDEKRMHKNLKDNGLQMIQVKIDKNRQGKKGWFYLAFDGDHMRFLPIMKEEPQ